jgi:programmed cell death 6-interacting protein
VGACCSEIAASAQLDQEEGLKTAAKLYQHAAGCFSFIRDNSLSATRSDCTLDFYPDALSLLIATMLAQAQEIFYIKAVDNKFKEGTIAKLAKQTSDYYADAMKAVQVGIYFSKLTILFYRRRKNFLSTSGSFLLDFMEGRLGV